MSSRLLASSLVALSIVAAHAPLVSAQSGNLTGGFAAGQYLLIGAGTVSPVRAQGTLRDWSAGNAVNVVWEGWYGGAGSDPGMIGFGLGGSFSRLPLNQQQFLSDFTTPAGSSATSANASSATVFSIETTFRVRIPAPFIMPSVSVGFGYLDFHPSSVHYDSPDGNASVSQQHRSGVALSLGAGLDKHIVQRFGIFAEALYTYGFTSLGEGIATPNGTCARNNGCDVLKNTSLGTLRGGLRLQVGQ